MVELLVGNTYSRLSGDVPKVVDYLLDQELSYTPADLFFQIAKVNRRLKMEAAAMGVDPKKWDGKIRLYSKHTRQFLTGLSTPVAEVLKATKTDFKFVDKRVRPAINCPDLRYVGTKEFRPYQSLAIRNSIRATRGILEIATGGGKTFTVAGLISELKTVPFVFYVMSGDLLEQTYTELSSSLNVPIGRVGYGYCDIQDVTVMMVQKALYCMHYEEIQQKLFDINDYKADEDDDWDEDDEGTGLEDAKKIRDYIRRCQGVYFDEAHHIASATARELMMYMPNAYWRFGGSATPYRDDGAEIYLQALLGKQTISVSTSWLIRNKYLVPGYIINVVVDQDLGDIKTWPALYKKYIVENDQINFLISEIVKMYESKGMSSLSLVKQYPHGEKLAELTGAPFIRGDKSKIKRKQVISDMREGKILSGIATSLADEGLDIPRLQCVNIASGGQSCTKLIQRIGRGLRLFENKDFSISVLFHFTRSPILDRHGTKVLNLLKKEEELTILTTTPAFAVADISNLINQLREKQTSI